MINFALGVLAGIVLTVAVPAVFSWGSGLVAKAKAAKSKLDDE